MANTPFNREQAAKRAEANNTNLHYLCQKWTRQIFGAPAVGDVDGDRDADAVDGWKSEPEEFRHFGDRNPPRGVPVAWGGGAKGFGHRAVSLGNRKIRSIDINGKVGTVDLSWFERNWGLKYLGWSETMSGLYIPKPVVAPAPTKKSNLQIAREVIAGKWGVGDDRVKRLRRAGYNPTTIQSLVNKLLG
jgi:hypothetical protein